MHHLLSSASRRLVTVVALSAPLVILTGCTTASFPSTSTPPSVTSGAVVTPPIQGSVYGGHAPLVGAQVYVLSPNLTSLYGQSISLMAGDSQNSGLVATGTGNGAVSAGGLNGYHYVTTDLTGAYNLTGDYACTVDQAVYLVAVGGSPTFPSASNVFGVSNASVSGSSGAYTVTFTTTSVENAYIGEQVTFTGLSGGGSLSDLNTGTYTIVSTNLTTSTFAVADTDTNTLTTSTQSGATATLIPTGNPAAINMTALGLCPASGSFAGSISYIYTNEVSTASMAIATAAFGSGPFNVGVATGGPVDSYYPNYDMNSLKQALNNANIIYDFTGGNVSTSYAGEGHIARTVTPGGNGIVPQALIDTWGNILAACVDSNNTGTGSLASPQCATLFATATSTGIACTVGSGNAITCPSGTTAPTDIATAAYNIAHFPAGTATTVGVNPAFVNTLYTLPSGNVPFTPNLVSTGAGQPNDFSVAIAFFVPATAGSKTSIIGAPQVIAINGGNYVGNESTYTGDANGELQESVWIGSLFTQPVKLYANGGAPDYTTNAALKTSGITDTRSVAMDTAGNVWMNQPESAGILEVSVTGSTEQTFVPGTGVTDFLDGAIDGIGTSYNLYSAAYHAIRKVAVVNGSTPSATNIQGDGTAGTASFSTPTATTGSGTAACTQNVTDIAFTPGGTMFVNTDLAAQCVVSTSTGAQVGTAGTGFAAQTLGGGPAPNAVDGNGVAWVGGGQNSSDVTYGLWSYTASGTSTQYTGGGMNDPCGVAVDGANKIWVGNNATYGVSVFSNAGVALSPVANTGTYANAVGGLNPQLKNTWTLSGTTYFTAPTATSNCASPAIDRAGDIWIAYQGDGAIYYPKVVFEILGIAAPVVTPRSYATFGNGTTGFLGQRPY